jgi:inosine-uridine nucleoside N-ribohydrolase
VPFAFRASHQHLGLEGIRLSEVVALAAISQPRFFTRESMTVDVETRGELTRGMTVFDRRGIQQWQTNIDVLVDVDTQGVLDYFADIVRHSVN